MRTILYRFLVFFFCSSISFFVFSDSALDQIYRRCGEIETSCSDIVTVTSSAINKIENETFTYNQYVNGSNVTTTVRVKEIGGFGHTVTELQRIYSNAVEISNRAGLIRQLATQLSSGGGGSYDDTDLMAELEEIEKYLHDLQYDFTAYFDMWVDLYDWFTPNKDNLTDFFENWGNFTNSLPDSFFYNFVTNKSATVNGTNPALFSSVYGWHWRSTAGDWILNGTNVGTFNPYINSSNCQLDKGRLRTLYDYISLLHFDTVYYGGIIGNTLSTNTQDTISFHRDFQKDFKSYSDFTTNKITEINSIFYNNSPLEDLQADVTPSNIYNFVTNYYIKVSTDPSGSASENKTNWFNRIEMLLTALVFRPEETATSNKFDNASDTQSEAFSDSLKSVLEGDISEIQGNSQIVLQDFEKTKTSLLKFFSHLDDKLSSLASIPSHIEFFEITTSSGDRKKVEIATQGSFASYADTLRAISTLCWISFFVYVIFVLSRWLFVKFSTILKFCYSVFKTLIGIG